jgi:hypothetical protein
VRHWQSAARDALTDGSLLFPAAPSDRPRYRGRWGVRVARDPLSLRSGIRFSDWRAEIIDAILRAG